MIVLVAVVTAVPFGPFAAQYARMLPMARLPGRSIGQRLISRGMGRFSVLQPDYDTDCSELTKNALRCSPCAWQELLRNVRTSVEFN